MERIKRVLIVDDEPGKRQALAEVAGWLLPGADILQFRCQNEIFGAISRDYLEDCQERPETQLLIIDMQMPFDVGDQVETESGFGVLDWLEQFELRCPAIIASSGQIDEERARRTYGHFLGAIRYSAFVSPKGALKELLAQLSAT